MPDFTEDQIKEIHAALQNGAIDPVFAVFKEFAATLMRIDDIDTEKMSSEDIKIEVEARKRAKKVIDSLLETFDSISKQGTEKPKLPPLIT